MSPVDASSMPAHFSSSHGARLDLPGKQPQHYTEPTGQWMQHYQPEPKHITLNATAQHQNSKPQLIIGPSSTHWNAPNLHQAHNGTHSASPIRVNALLPPSSYSPKSFPASLGAQKHKSADGGKGSTSRALSNSSLSATTALGQTSPSKSPVPSLTSSASTESASSASNSETRTPPSATPPHLHHSRSSGLVGVNEHMSASTERVYQHDEQESKGGKSGSATGHSFKSNADREAYLARNRLAASRSRQRKKQRVGELESRAHEYSVLNQMLQQQAIALHSEFLQLRSMLTHVVETTPPDQMSHELQMYLERERAGQAGVAYINSLAGDTLSTDYAFIPNMYRAAKAESTNTMRPPAPGLGANVGTNGPRPAAQVPPTTAGRVPPPPPPPTPPRSGGGGGKTVPLLIAVLGLGGAAYYVMSEPAPRAQAKHDLEVVKDKASSLVHKAEDKLNVDTSKAYNSRLRDFETSERNRAGSKIDPALGKVVESAHDAKEEVKGWFGARESEAEKAKRKAKDAADDVKQEASSWLNWGSKKVEQGKDAAAAAFERGKRAAHDAKEDAKQEGRSWLSWGSSKADEAKRRASNEYEHAKSAAHGEVNAAKSGGLAWMDILGSRQNDPTVNRPYDTRTIDEAARDTYNSAASSMNHALNNAKDNASEFASRAEYEAQRQKEYLQQKGRQASDFAERKTEEAKQEASSWFNWSGQKAQDAADATAKEAENAKQGLSNAAYDAKEAVKSGLLKAERATERGAQKAQEETRKL
ncbi:hypothetical protein OIV83_001918 [Microbotryomycetes sp. JL201]|nr:hypothetical protein OIV83_001918 [Microbotryomycetes sp. JL201]